MAKVAAVISVKGDDQKAVVARFATYLAECGINIDDLQQHVVRGVFVMDMLVDLGDSTESLDKLMVGLVKLGGDMGMEVRVTLNSERKKKKVGVLVSKEPHCLEKIIKDHKAGLYGGAELAVVLSNHEELRGIAEEAGLAFEWLPSTDKAAHMTWLRERLQAAGVDLVVLARYMQILTADVVEAFTYQIINIHPSLLPHFPGPAPYRQAFEKGVRVSGSTAHFVTVDLDEGPIVLQDVFTINVGKDSLDEVKRKGIDLEAGVLSQAVQYFLNEELVVVDGCVVFKPGLNNLVSDDEDGGLEGVE